MRRISGCCRVRWAWRAQVHRIAVLRVGLAGQRAPREALLAHARELPTRTRCSISAGATSPHAEVVVLRVLAPVVEPAMQLLRQVWQAWRTELWQLRSGTPRIWST
jgi:urease accessory protein